MVPCAVSFRRANLPMTICSRISRIMSSKRLPSNLPCERVALKHYTTWQGAATLCNALQRTAAHCNVLQRTVMHCNVLHRTTTYCNVLQHTATCCNTLHHTWRMWAWKGCLLRLSRVSTWHEWCHQVCERNTLQQTCNTLQHTATHWCNKACERMTHLQHTATHCNTLQHTATHCNTLQHTDVIKYASVGHCNLM